MKTARVFYLACALLILASCTGQDAAPPTTEARSTTVVASTPTAAVLATPRPSLVPLILPNENHDYQIIMADELRTYGGRLNDNATDVLLLEDGGMLLAGLADSPGPSHRITTGKARLVRTDAAGNVLWEQRYGGELDASFSAVALAGQNNFVALGEVAASYERDETDLFLVKVDGEGNEIWARTFGGRGMDHGKVVRQTADGGFILTGGTADEYVTRNLYAGNLILIKTDAEGNEEWSRTYGSSILYLGWAVAQTPDGGYVAAGWEARTIPDRDVYLIKTDSEGVLEWSRSWDLDPRDRDMASDMVVTSDGFIVLACIQSLDSGTIVSAAIKLDLQGNEIWRKSFLRGEIGAEFWDVMEDADGGYVFSGIVFSSLERATGRVKGDGWIIKTDRDGSLLWESVVRHAEYEELLLSAAAVLPDGGYVFVGSAMQTGEVFSNALWLRITEP